VLTTALAYLAGALSTLSPCVLPLIPLVVGSAMEQHRLGPAALAAGLAVSFATLGVLVATIGFALGIDVAAIRYAGAVLMLAFGVVLLSSRLQLGFVQTTAGMAAPLNAMLDRVTPQGPAGQFGLGVLLGAVWAPCTGPALGSAITLAAQGETALYAAAVMAVFALGAVTPLLLLGYGARGAMGDWKRRLSSVSAGGRTVLGAILVAFGVLVLTGVDKVIETRLLDLMPEWWVDLTIRF
jgi:cytochrome c-type biogenesis protein